MLTSAPKSHRPSLIGRFNIEHLTVGVPHLSDHASSWRLGISIIGEMYSFVFLARCLICLFVRGWSYSTTHGLFCWGWNSSNIPCALMLNLMVSTHISMRALALLKNGHPWMRGILRSPSTSSIMKFMKTTWLWIHTGMWYNFPLGWRKVYPASCTWTSVRAEVRPNLSFYRLLWAWCWCCPQITMGSFYRDIMDFAINGQNPKPSSHKFLLWCLGLHTHMVSQWQILR